MAGPSVKTLARTANDKPSLAQLLASHAAHHLTTAYVDLGATEGTSQTATFSTPTGGLGCVLTIEGAGDLLEPARVSVAGSHADFQTVRRPGGWAAVGMLPESTQWWTAIACTVAVRAGTDIESARYVRVSTLRPTGWKSTLEHDFLPARRADSRLPDRDARREASIAYTIEGLLAEGEVEEAVRLTVSALALGLEDVKNTLGVKVLRAAAGHSDFAVSNDGLKLFIAMSS